MQGPPVQVTVVEYINEFFKNYSRRAYGKTLLVNANKGAETLMGMLKLVLSRGGRDELRIALHCFKDQLMNALNSPASIRQQQVEEVFALMSSLVDAAERLRHFSPVKEQLSSAVLEEVRFRLYRIIVGDGFCEDVCLRRRALDVAFTGMMREADEQERSRARINKLSSTGAAPAAATGALVVAGQHAAGLGAIQAADGGGKGPGRLRGSFQRKAAALSGPDFSSWEGLWTSLASMSPKRMLPLLQVVMTDLYTGKLMPGTPGAAAAAAAAAGGGNGSSSSCAATSRGTNTPPKHSQSLPLPVVQQQQQPERVQSLPLRTTYSQEALLLQQQQQSDSLQCHGPLVQQHSSQQQQQQQAGSVVTATGSDSMQEQPRSTTATPAVLSPRAVPAAASSSGAVDAGAGKSTEPDSSCSSNNNSGKAREASLDGTVLCDSQLQQQQQQADTAAGPLYEPHAAVQGALELTASGASSSDGTPVPAQHCSNQLPTAPQQQQQQQSTRFGRSSARPGHPITAGYGTSVGPTASSSSSAAVADSSGINSSGINSSDRAPGGTGIGVTSTSSSSSPKLSSVAAESRGAFASLASRLGSGGTNRDKGGGSSSTGNSPVSGGSKWSTLAGGFLGLQSTGSGGLSNLGSGRLIPRGWVQFAGHGHQQQQPHQKGAAVEPPMGLSDPQASTSPTGPFAVGAAVDAGGQERQPDQVSAAAEPPTPGKGPAVGSVAAPGSAGAGLLAGVAGVSKPLAAVVAGSGVAQDVVGVADDAGGAGVHGFEGDEPDWGSGSSSCCAARGAATAVHCTVAAAPPAGL